MRQYYPVIMESNPRSSLLHKSFERMPYGSPEMIRRQKKQYPDFNIHYSHHDSVLPSKDLIKMYEEVYKGERPMPNEKSPGGQRAKEYLGDTVGDQHFKSEYKRRFNGSPESGDDNVKVVPPLA